MRHRPTERRDCGPLQRDRFDRIPDRTAAPHVHIGTACTNSRFEFCTPCILNLADFCPSSRHRSCSKFESTRTRDKTCHSSPDRLRTATSPFSSETTVIVACETHEWSLLYILGIGAQDILDLRPLSARCRSPVDQNTFEHAPLSGPVSITIGPENGLCFWALLRAWGAGARARPAPPPARAPGQIWGPGALGRGGPGTQGPGALGRGALGGLKA